METYALLVPRKLVKDLLTHFGPDPVTKGWCHAADLTTKVYWFQEVKDESKEPQGSNLRTHRLTDAAVRRGLAALVGKHQYAMEGVFDPDKQDAPTADLFVQLCLFGEEKYA